MSKKSFHLPVRNSLTIIVFCFLFNLPFYAQEFDEVGTLWDKFKQAAKADCGQRDEAVKIGKRFVELYEKYHPNSDVAEYVKKRIPIIEEEDGKCKGNEFLVTLYKNYNQAKSAACGYRDEAIRLGDVIAKQFGDDSIVSKSIKAQVAAIEKEEQECRIANANDPLETLFEKFKTALKEPCGKRAEAVRIGKEIIEKFGDDKDNQELIKYLKKDVPKIEAAEKNCPTYN